jgi:hypothetical protein
MGRVSLRPDGSTSSRCATNQTSLQTAANWGDNCYSDTDDTGGEQKMVYIPQFCYYVDYVAAHNIVWWVGQVGDQFTLQAADGTFTGGTYTFSSSDIHQAFIVDSVAKSAAYVSAYEGYYNSGLGYIESKAGVTPTGTDNATVTTGTLMRTYVEAAGVGWEIATVQMYSALQYLYVIEYASLNSQSALGYGFTNTTLQNTGTTTSYGNASYGGANTVAMSFRGVENLWGNTRTFIEGMNVNSGAVYISPQSRGHTYAWGISTSPYASASVTIPSANSYITAVASSPAWAFLPSAASGGSASTYFCDQETEASGWAAELFGGYYTSSNNAGVFAQFAAFTATHANVNCVRVQYLPS